jgi:hypothetical protein
MTPFQFVAVFSHTLLRENSPQPLVGMNLADGKTSVVFGKINAGTIDASIFALPKACGSGAHIQREGSLIFGL